MHKLIKTVLYHTNLLKGAGLHLMCSQLSAAFDFI